jgi:hypothetical protein
MTDESQSIFSYHVIKVCWLRQTIFSWANRHSVQGNNWCFLELAIPTHLVHWSRFNILHNSFSHPKIIISISIQPNTSPRFEEPLPQSTLSPQISLPIFQILPLPHPPASISPLPSHTISKIKTSPSESIPCNSICSSNSAYSSRTIGGLRNN